MTSDFVFKITFNFLIPLAGQTVICFFQLSVFFKQWASYIAIISTILYPSYHDCALLYANIGVRLQAQLILVLKLKVQSWVLPLTQIEYNCIWRVQLRRQS